MPHLEHEGCQKHERKHWTRLKAPTPRLVGGGPGIWGCNVCHPVPEALLPEVEFFDEQVHGPVFDAILAEIRGDALAADPDAPTPMRGHVIGQTKLTTVKDLEEATKLFEKWKADEFGWIRGRILRLAAIHGEYHGDLIEGIEVSSPNIVGAAVGALSKQGLIEKLNRDGVPEHRMSRIASNRRASWVWRLTPKGRAYSEKFKKDYMGGTNRLPGPKRKNAIDGDVSRDGTTIQGVLSA